MSRQAFSKQREYIKPEAFMELSNAVVEEFEECDEEKEEYRGYRLFAVDGTLIDLPNNKRMIEEFGASSNGTTTKYAKGLAITVCDVLNKLAITGQMYRYDDSEKKRIFDVIEEVEARGYKKGLWLLDRGYPSFDLYYALQEMGRKFVIRVSSNALKEINEANKADQIIRVTREGKTVTLRVVNLLLNSGVTEKLVTNLPEEFDINDLMELYAQRWGIETSYRFLKNSLSLEVFTGETKTAVLQDFYAGIFLTNMATIIEREQADMLDDMLKDRHLTQDYHPSRTKIMGDLKENVVGLLLIDSARKRKKAFDTLFLRVKENAWHPPKEKSFPRKYESSRRSNRKSHPKSLH